MSTSWLRQELIKISPPRHFVMFATVEFQFLEPPKEARIAKCASDAMTQTNKLVWQTIFLKHILKQPVFLKHFFETKTSLRFPLFLSEHTDVVWVSWGV